MKEESVTLRLLHVQSDVYPKALKIINENFKVIKQIDKCFLKTIFFPLPRAAHSPQQFEEGEKRWQVGDQSELSRGFQTSLDSSLCLKKQRTQKEGVKEEFWFKWFAFTE